MLAERAAPNRIAKDGGDNRYGVSRLFESGDGRIARGYDDVWFAPDHLGSNVGKPLDLLPQRLDRNHDILPLHIAELAEPLTERLDPSLGLSGIGTRY
jgi:hypothetical protein